MPANEGLHRIPYPLNVFELLTGSHHYHFGLSPREDEPLAPAMDRLFLVRFDHIRLGGRVFDVGAGLGGAVALLARAGFPAVGIDSSVESIAYARSIAPAGVELASRGIGRYGGGPFDGILLTEVLQHFPRLDSLLGRCSRLLAPGGLTIVNDLVLHTDVSWRSVPVHREGALAAAARQAGFRVELRVDLTERVVPTLPFLLRMLRERRDETLAFFAARPRIEDEIEELRAQILHVLRGFEDGHVTYEATILQLDGRPSP